MAKTPKTPHDALFRRTFSLAENAAAELRAILPGPLVSQVDWQSLRLCGGSFVDGALASLHSDLLYSVKVSDREALVYVLFEHQSKVEPLMPLRLLKYVVRVLERHVREKAGSALPLPLVIPVLVHHSEKGWTAGRSMEELFDPGALVEPEIAALVPKMNFVLDDISRVADEEIMGRMLGPEASLVLWALRDARSGPKLLSSLVRWGPMLAELARTSEEALRTIASYILVVTDALSAEELRWAVRAAAPQAEGAIMTAAEQLIAKGRAEGRAEGRTEGRTEGRVEVLIRQLTLKFGPLTQDTRQRVLSASEAELDRWSETILTAKSLVEVVGK